ncbi:NAD/NADP octopine/nopaline dehydrogenase family protein [Ensifer sp. ENS05]|uniref:NAD/NADP octopine/nopaline dehydrogenase family protein n=1 Tax=Ensifer sp. ENS05 TaxID=2769277 RepID=UPI0035C76C98
MDSQHRYLIEDMPYGLAFFESLAHRVGVYVPVLISVISLLEVMYEVEIARRKLHPRSGHWRKRRWP